MAIVLLILDVFHHYLVSYIATTAAEVSGCAPKCGVLKGRKFAVAYLIVQVRQ
jgi:hypothetical protein